MIGKYIKEDGIKYCKNHECKVCPLKGKVCINESGEFIVPPHIDFEKFTSYYNAMNTEITMCKIAEKYRNGILHNE